MADLLNNTNSNANNYGDDAIVTLSPREHIRLRPGMYVGVAGRRFAARRRRSTC